MIRISTPSRLHITLIDLNGSLGRVDGGVGLALESPNIEIEASTSDTIEISGNTGHKDRIINSVKKLLPESSGIRLAVKKDYPSHVGLGSGTQVSLAAGMAVNGLYGLGLNVHDIARQVGRGGTSGIGVEAFENGGLIIDGGHKFSEKKAFLPSAASKLPPPPVIIRRDFPDWDIAMAIPQAKGASDKNEVDIFGQECPIPLAEVQTLSHIILMGLLPAVAEEDLPAFGKCINMIQETGFKKREVAFQPVSRRVMEIMRDCGAYGAGMSSFGPAVFGFGEDPHDLTAAVADYLETEGGGYAFITQCRNRGADIS